MERRGIECESGTSRVNLKPANLGELINSLHILFETDKVNIEDVQTVMENYESNEDEWEKYAVYDHYRYTRNLVDEGNGRFDLILLCWSEGQGSAIHSHSNSHCFMKVMEGSLQESMYAWPEDNKKTAMKKLAVNDYNRDQVAYINDSKGLHRVENVSHSNRSASLHLYSPPIISCKCFDERTGRANTGKVTFWSRFGERTPYTPNVCACIEPENN